MLRGIVAEVTKGSENDGSPRPVGKAGGCTPSGLGGFAAGVDPNVVAKRIDVFVGGHVVVIGLSALHVEGGGPSDVLAVGNFNVPFAGDESFAFVAGDVPAADLVDVVIAHQINDGVFGGVGHHLASTVAGTVWLNHTMSES